jgi:signal transduction histidine kinase
MKAAADAESRQGLQAVLRLLSDAVLRFEPMDGRPKLTLAEGQLAQELGWAAPRIGAGRLPAKRPELDLGTDARLMAAFSSEVAPWTRRVGGRTLRMSARRAPDGAVVVQVADVTDWMRAEEQARHLNKELLGRLVQLREANLSLEQANRDLDGFAAAASHDLRTPLTVIGALARSLELRIHDEKSKAQLASILDHVRGMGELIADLLAFSRAGLRSIVPEAVDVAHMARDIVAHLQAEDPERRVEWRIEEGLTVQADRGLLRVVLSNLLGNAWKYTANVPQPVITVRGEGHDPIGRPVVAVSDNGIGFTANEAASLFQAFVRLPGSKEYPGTGLGLATVRRIVERHGGRVWAEARPGEGATFRFTLARGA